MYRKGHAGLPWSYCYTGVSGEWNMIQLPVTQVQVSALPFTFWNSDDLPKVTFWCPSICPLRSPCWWLWNTSNNTLKRCVCVCLCACACVCMCVCVCVRVCMCVCVCIHAASLFFMAVSLLIYACRCLCLCVLYRLFCLCVRVSCLCLCVRVSRLCLCVCVQLSLSLYMCAATCFAWMMTLTWLEMSTTMTLTLATNWRMTLANTGRWTSSAGWSLETILASVLRSVSNELCLN